MNSPFMATPFKAVSSGVRDGYNFYHSQIRINIECAFGMLVNRWAVLRSPIPLNISICKTTSLVRALCCLHNYLIDEKPPISGVRDRLHILSRGGMVINQGNSYDITDMIGGNMHFDDTNRHYRNNYVRSLFRRMQRNPREYLLDKLCCLGINARPKPMGSTTTNTS